MLLQLVIHLLTLLTAAIICSLPLLEQMDAYNACRLMSKLSTLLLNRTEQAVAYRLNYKQAPSY